MFKFLGVVMSLIITTLVRGFVLVKLWLWFILPMFPTAPKLTIPFALGISLLLNYICGSSSESKDSKGDSFGEVIGMAVVKSIVTALFVLFMGWIFTLFM